MAWIESHDDVWEHHKILKLCRIIKRPDYAIVGHMHSLWHFVLRNSWKSADLSGWGDEGIEKAARWDGVQGDFVTALRETRLLDGCVVHGWLERAGRLVYDRIRKQKQRKSVIKNVHKLSTISPGQSKATVPYPTVPNSTQPNSTNRYMIPPTLEAVTAYCLERKNGIEPQQFIDYNSARGWMLGKSKMKDWQATIRTWEKNKNGNGWKNGQSRVVGGAAPEPGKYAHLTEG